MQNYWNLCLTCKPKQLYGPVNYRYRDFRETNPQGRFHKTFPMAERQGTVHLAFRLHRLDPSHRGLGYCSWKQDTKERYWGQQFCPIMERDSFGPTDQTDQTGQIGLPSKRGTFHSTKIPVWNFRNFTCPMELCIPVAQTPPKPPRVWLL